jgi:hypothetical protein
MCAEMWERTARRRLRKSECGPRSASPIVGFKIADGNLVAIAAGYSGVRVLTSSVNARDFKPSAAETSRTVVVMTGGGEQGVTC